MLPDLDFAYGIFVLFDEAVGHPDVTFSEETVAQGFSRAESGAWFKTPLEFGDGYLRVAIGPFEATGDYDRAVAVPFHCISGCVTIAGPDEPLEEQRSFDLPPGYYRLTVAQRVVDEEGEDIDLFFEPLAEPAKWSEVLIADESMRPPGVIEQEAGNLGN
ncbi:competence protein ComJ [Haloferula sp. BvORR071]|uniref:competence protein ComJ n=1 Tax=Haloferula sp. BvORR071 TaxID=1396141 RepID=UPI000554B2FE|nr:competence protein ComJ [Haloferula sp. BvORR071]